MWLTFITTVVSFAGPLVADHQDIQGVWQEVCRDHQSQANQLNGLSVSWIRQRIPTRSAEETMREIDPRGHYAPDFFEDHKSRWRFDRGHYHLHQHARQSYPSGEDEWDDDYVDTVTEISFDGENFYHGFLNDFVDPDEPRMLLIEPLSVVVEESPEGDIFTSNLPSLVGFKIPTEPIDHAGSGAESRLLRLKQRFAHADLSWVTSNQTTVLCVSVPAPNCGSEHYFVDPENGGLLIGHELRDTYGRLIRETVCEGFEPVEGTDGLLWPRRCEVRHHQWKGQPAIPADTPLFREVFETTECRAGTLSPGTFVIAYDAPGTFVFDKSFNEMTEEETFYSYPARQSQMDQIIASIATESHVAFPWWIPTSMMFVAALAMLIRCSLRDWRVRGILERRREVHA